MISLFHTMLEDIFNFISKPNLYIMPLMVAEVVTEKFSYDLPTTIDPSAKYIFFLHGKGAEIYGPNSVHPRFGIYDYHGIIRAFTDRGFQVISEIRSKKTMPNKYAGKVTREVETLLANCVPPENIAVAGFSKGRSIALCVAAKLRNPKVNFVVMGGCSNKRVHARKQYNKYITQIAPLIMGRFLAIHDISERRCNICRKIYETLSNKVKFEEIQVKSGLKRGLFYQPRNIWIDTVSKWINLS